MSTYPDEFDQLHKRLVADAKHQPEYANNTESALHGYSEGVEHAFETIRQRGYVQHRTITTVDELDEAVYAAFEDGGHLVLSDRQGRPWIIWADEDGDEVVNSWPQEEDPKRLALSDIRLPATVMHHGARTVLHEGS